MPPDGAGVYVPPLQVPATHFDASRVVAVYSSPCTPASRTSPSPTRLTIAPAGTAHDWAKSANVLCTTWPLRHVMVTVTLPDAVPPRPSSMVYVNVSVPHVPGFGL